MSAHRMTWHPDELGGGELRCADCGVSGIFRNSTLCPARREIVQQAPRWKALAWLLVFVLSGVGWWFAGAWVWGT